MVKVMFVCMGNICRSPTAEGVFRHHAVTAGHADRLRIDSAGTHAYHVGEPPDRRAVAAAERRGISLQNIRARRVSDEDFERFDHIIAMDEDNLASLLELAPQYRSKVRLFLEFSSGSEREVPDPYYGGPRGFDYVLDLIEAASAALLDDIRQRHGI